jgi:hypothetical protein
VEFVEVDFVDIAATCWMDRELRVVQTAAGEVLVGPADREVPPRCTRV